MMKRYASAIVIFSAVAFTACGSGGGGSSSSSATSITPPVVTSSPVPTPTPTPMPDAKGIAVDDTTGQPIAGATIVISQQTVIAGATAPPSGSKPWPSATSAPDGSFDVQNVPRSLQTFDFSFVGARFPMYPNYQWIQIFSPDGHASYHGIWTINPSGTTDLGKIGIAMPTADETAWLTKLNLDRSTVGTPAVTVPLILDSVTLQTARYWAQEMAAEGFYAHQCPAASTTCTAFWLYGTQHHSLPDSQNIDYGTLPTMWPTAESQFMVEQANCVNGNWLTCTYAENTGHYINIMSATRWVGFGIAAGKNPSNQLGTNTAFFVQNFAAPYQGTSIQGVRRSLDIL